MISLRLPLQLDPSLSYFLDGPTTPPSHSDMQPSAALRWTKNQLSRAQNTREDCALRSISQSSMIQADSTVEQSPYGQHITNMAQSISLNNQQLTVFGAIQHVKDSDRLTRYLRGLQDRFRSHMLIEPSDCLHQYRGTSTMVCCGSSMSLWHLLI